MNLFAPLRGLRPRPELAQGIAEPPYDVMTRAEAHLMAAGRPNSFLHVSRPEIDLPDEFDSGSPQACGHAGDVFAEMIAAGLLRRDEAPTYYVYRMSREGREQVGVFGAASVAAYDAGLIRKHELTRPAKQSDRAAHIRATNAQTGPAFLIYRAVDQIEEVVAQARQATPETTVLGPRGVLHEIWPITEPRQLERLEAGFASVDTMYIADGHHRSAAASMVHAERGASDGPSAQFLAVAVPSDQVNVLAYNRVVADLAGHTPETFLAAVADTFTVTASDRPVSPGGPAQFGMYVARRWWKLGAPAGLAATRTAVESLDVAMLAHDLLTPILDIRDPRTDPRIGFVGGARELEELAEMVDSGQWAVAFSMFPTTVADLIAVADSGEIMPPKSTWFEPKLLDGLVSNVLD